MSARFEIVRTGGHYSSFAGRTIGSRWHARFRAANGQIVWTTETYTRRRAALDAIHQIAKPCPHTPWPVGVMVERHGAIEVRDVDERTSAQG